MKNLSLFKNLVLIFRNHFFSNKLLFASLLLLSSTLLIISCNKEDTEAYESSSDNDQVIDLKDFTNDPQLDVRSCTAGAFSASFNGVAAYVNCPIGSATTYGNNYVNGIYVGKKWQCVEYVQRYYYLKYGMNIKPFFGNANTYWNNTTHSSAGLQKFVNGSVPPLVGDILVSTSGTYGHVAIVTSVTSTSVGIIDQNFSINSARTLTRNGNNIGNFSTNYTVKGLVRKAAPAQTPTLISPAASAQNLVNPISFSWSCPNATEYRIQIIERSNYQGFSASNGFSGAMAFNNNIGNINTFLWTGAQKNKTYYWTVRANNSVGASYFSQFRVFKTKP